MKKDRDFKKVLKDNLTRIMEKHDLSQEDMGKACHIERQSFNKIYNGHVKLDAEKVFLLQLNDISPLEIFYDEEYELKKAAKKIDDDADMIRIDYFMDDPKTQPEVVVEKIKRLPKIVQMKFLAHRISVYNQRIEEIIKESK